MSDVIAELLEQVASAAIAEALSVPKLMERGGDIWWRGRDGNMVRLTASDRGLAVAWCAP